MTFEERIRASLGLVPPQGVREVMPYLEDARSVRLSYEWIIDWDPLDGLPIHYGPTRVTVWDE
jgi:hypothetical protein